MSVLSKLQGLVGELRALAGSEDEEASAALAKRAGALLQAQGTASNAEQWRLAARAAAVVAAATRPAAAAHPAAAAATHPAAAAVVFELTQSA